MRLENRVAIITGAGNGIGRAIAERFAREGARVTIADIEDDAGRETLSIINEAGGEAMFVHMDTSNRKSVEAGVAKVVEAFGPVNTLVNNAAAFVFGKVEDLTDDAWAKVFGVNVVGYANCVNAVLPHMRAQGGGAVVNIASVAGRQGSPRNTPYNVSKSGVISLTQAYALALAPFNINVNAICPGLLWTPMWERIATRTINLDDSLEGTTPRQAFEQFVAQSIPLGREQTPQDIGRLAVFLASDLSLNITGQSINVNGGSRMD